MVSQLGSLLSPWRLEAKLLNKAAEPVTSVAVSGNSVMYYDGKFEFIDLTIAEEGEYYIKFQV